MRPDSIQLAGETVAVDGRGEFRHEDASGCTWEVVPAPGWPRHEYVARLRDPAGWTLLLRYAETAQGAADGLAERVALAAGAHAAVELGEVGP